MKPPADLRAPGRRAWNEAIKSLTALGDEPELSAGAIERYAHAADTLAHLEREWKRFGSPTLTFTRTGRELPHPLIRELEQQRAHVAMLGQSLLLDPHSRARASRSGGRQKGASPSEDRAYGLRAVR